MAYIYEKRIHGIPYYYLRISKRVKGKVIAKDIAYLGKDISKIQEKLDKLPSKYMPEIRKGYRNIKLFIDSNYYLEKAKALKLKSDKYLDKDTQNKIEAIRLHFANHFSKLHEKTKLDVYKDFLIEFAYNTTSIEGNTITLKEANNLLRENLTPKSRTPREIFDLQNTEKVFFYLLEKKPKLTQELIIKVHDMLVENIDERKGYRTTDTRIFKSHFDASPAKYVKIDMDLLFKWYNKYKNKLHPLVLAMLFHQKFEKIHPFADGNGRTGRMIMNCILMQSKYPPLIIRKKNRSEYLDALSKADKSGLDNIELKHFKDLISYVSMEFIDSYWQNFNV
jgi:Fic family protein